MEYLAQTFSGHLGRYMRFYKRRIWMTKLTHETHHPLLSKILCIKGSIHVFTVIYVIYETNP